MQHRIILCLLLLLLMVGTVSADTLIYKIAAIADDGYVAELTDSSWQTMRDAAGDTFRTDTGTTYDPIRLLATTTSNEYNENRRGVLLFNTSTIPDDAIIGSSDFAVCGAGGKATALGSPDIVLVGFSYIAGTAISEELYNNFNTNRLATDIPIGSWSTSNWNNWTLNTEGKNYINKTGATPLMLMNSWDYSNSSTGITWSSANKTTILWRDRSTSITTNIPTLTVVYSLPDTTPPAASFTTSKNFLRIPNSVTATDTSTNTPTSWEWSWGDGTANSTTQNPTHQYLKRGKFDIYLTATNAGGSGSTGATSVKVVGYENYY